MPYFVFYEGAWVFVKILSAVSQGSECNGDFLFSPQDSALWICSVSQERSTLKPLARWFRRWLMWLFGIGHKVFAKNCDQDIEGFFVSSRRV
jgi:hypothetical protein